MFTSNELSALRSMILETQGGKFFSILHDDSLFDALVAIPALHDWTAYEHYLIYATKNRLSSDQVRADAYSIHSKRHLLSMALNDYADSMDAKETS